MKATLRDIRQCSRLASSLKIYIHVVVTMCNCLCVKKNRVILYSLCSPIGRSKKRRRKQVSSEEESEESEEEEEEGSGEEMWVEKKLKKDKDDAFVGPVPDLKVQGQVGKKE